LVDDIFQFIGQRKISIIPASLSLNSFDPDLYTPSQSTILIQKGFNPKMSLYLLHSQTRSQKITDWTQKLGNTFSNLPTDFWFCFIQSKCDSNCQTNCKDSTDKFIYKSGFRTQKSNLNKIGSGGFGSVFSGKIHGIKVAIKYIDVTQKYKDLLGKPGTSYVPSDVIAALVGDVAFEATIQSGFGHPNILPARDFWIQCSNLDKIELAIATKLCYKNLQEWLDTETFKFGQIRRFLIEVGEGLKYLDRQKLSHRDIKPANILLTDLQSPVAVITDFGLIKSDGVTPVYCAPEAFIENGTQLGKNDIYSYGITILYCLFDLDEASVMLFGTGHSIPTPIFNQANNDQIILLVKRMVNYDPNLRPTFAQIKQDLGQVSPVNGNPVHLAAWATPGAQTLNLSFGLKSVSIAKKPVHPSAKIHPSIISGKIHDQKDSNLCWAFSASSVLQSEVKRIIHRLHKKSKISKKVFDETIKLAIS